MTELERLEKAYPGILFPQLGKGGYTFFKRVIAENLRSGKPVFFNTGKLVFQYEHKPEHQTFMDGATKMEGDDVRTEEVLADINAKYQLEMGLREVRQELQQESAKEKKGWFPKWR